MSGRRLFALPFAAVLGLASGCTSTSEPLPLGNDSASCGACHETHHDEWSRSPHGTSHSSPIFEAMLPDVEAVWGDLARSTCEGCHSPEHSDEPAIGCVSCHAAVGNRAERDGMLAVDLDAPLAGPLDDPEPTVAHASRDGGFLSSASLCGTCHEITGPELVDEPTLTEFRGSPQAAEGRTCMDCHLPREEERALSNASSRLRPSRSHRFVGFDPIWGASEEEALVAAERTRRLLAEALTLEVSPTPDGLEVVVRNTGAGHAVPTGATFLRDLWVDVEVDGGVAHPRILRLGDQPMRGETPVALLTEADHVEHGSLAAGDEVRVRVATEASAGRVVLRGRAVRDEVLEALAITDRRAEIPTHEIHSRAFER